MTLRLSALELGGRDSVTALVFALRGLGDMVAAVPAGCTVSRFGDKPMMLFGIAMTAFMGFVCSDFDNTWQLSIAAFLLGGGIAI